MSKGLRQYTQKGDPRLRVKLPLDLLEALFQEAKLNKRRPQDELSKRIAATFHHAAEYKRHLETLKELLYEAPTDREYIQIISRDLLNFLQHSADLNQHELSEEVFFRLKVSFIAEIKMGTIDAFSKIQYKKFTPKELEEQRIAALPGRMQLYELQKLELILRFEDCVSEEEKMSFKSIDFVKETKEIRKRLRQSKI